MRGRVADGTRRGLIRAPNTGVQAGGSGRPRVFGVHQTGVPTTVVEMTVPNRASVATARARCGSAPRSKIEIKALSSPERDPPRPFPSFDDAGSTRSRRQRAGRGPAVRPRGRPRAGRLGPQGRGTVGGIVRAMDGGGAHGDRTQAFPSDLPWLPSGGSPGRPHRRPTVQRMSQRMSLGKCLIGSVRPDDSRPCTEPPGSITSVEDRIALGGATRPPFPSPLPDVPSGTVEMPGGRVPAVGWSIRLAADCAAAGPEASSPRKTVVATIRRGTNNLITFGGGAIVNDPASADVPSPVASPPGAVSDEPDGRGHDARVTSASTASRPDAGGPPPEARLGRGLRPGARPGTGAEGQGRRHPHAPPASP